MARYCSICEKKVEHLKKHMKLEHPEEFKIRSEQKEEKIITKRPHTCPVVYLQNFCHISPDYYKKLKNYTVKNYREPERNDFIVYVHDKATNSPIIPRTLNRTGIRKNFYSNRVENYLKKLESQVGQQFSKIRTINKSTFIDPFPIFRYMMSQLIRTPKFQDKIMKDQIYLMKMDNELYENSFMKDFLVPKPKVVDDIWIKKIHEDFILRNLLEFSYKRFTFTLCTNHTTIPFITSDSPVVYNNVEFLPSYLDSEEHFEFSMIFNAPHSVFNLPIDSNYCLMIQNFKGDQNEAKITYDDIFDVEFVMLINMLEYQYSERFIYLKKQDDALIREIQEKCGTILNKDYQSLEFFHKNLRIEGESNN